jgi:phosphatidylglycerophosphatase A
MDWIALFIASAGFTGFIPQLLKSKKSAGGGLIGSMISLAVLLWMVFRGTSFHVVLIFVILSFLAGMASIKRAEKVIMTKWGVQARHTGEKADHDFNQTNIDEVHGQLVAGLPVFLFVDMPLTGKMIMLFWTFVFFRIFDVFKPWPIGKIENISHGPSAVMLDDTAAGVYAGLLVWLWFLLLSRLST